VRDKKLASVGLRIRRGASYHGLALNVALDLEPFQRIDVCGHRGLEVTQLADLSPGLGVEAAARGLEPHLLRALDFSRFDQSAISTAAQAESSR
jgi:lipoyl(octanoyl) transferase